jgi:hypothetical protein
LKIIECDELGEGKTVQVGDIIFVGTKTPEGYKNAELQITQMAG